MNMCRLKHSGKTQRTSDGKNAVLCVSRFLRFQLTCLD